MQLTLRKVGQEEMSCEVVGSNPGAGKIFFFLMKYPLNVHVAVECKLLSTAELAHECQASLELTALKEAVKLKHA